MSSVKVNFEAFDRQAEPLLSTAEILCVVAGARGGKTQVGAYRTVMDALYQPGYTEAEALAGEPYTIAVGAPTYPLLNRVIMPTVLRYIPGECTIEPYHKTEKRVRVAGRLGPTDLLFISCVHVSSWYSLKLWRIWCDEFALIKEEMYDEFQTRLSDRKGRLMLTGTPQGPNWAYERLYLPHKQRRPEAENIDFYSWTTMDNPYMDAQFIENKRRQMPAKYFRRTFEATWDTFEGQVYDEFLPEVHVRPRADYTFILPRGQRVGNGSIMIRLAKVIAGVDWGYGPGHAGVILVLGVDTTGRWWVLAESVDECVLKVAEPIADSWLNRARRFHVKWGVERFYCDTADPEAIAQFRRAGLPAVGAVKDVLPGIEAVARYVHPDEDTQEPMLFIMNDCQKTIDEMVFYHWKPGNAKEAPEKVNDNCMDALRYGVYTQELRGRFKREPAFAG